MNNADDRKYYGDTVWHVENGVPVGGALTGVSQNGLVVSIDFGDAVVWKSSKRVYRTEEECRQSIKEEQNNDT